MKDLVIKNTGNSRKIRTSLKADTTWNEALELMRSGDFPIDLLGLQDEGVEQKGTPYSKGAVLSDTTAATLGLSGDPNVNDALGTLAALASSGGSGSGDVGELEDLTVKVGRLTNAGAGWNTYRFPEPLEAAPQAVLLQPVDFPGWAEVRNITAEGFLYCLRQPVYTAGEQGSVKRDSYYTASGTSSSSSHSAQTLVYSVTLPTLPTAENKTTTATVEVIWLAIEFNGGKN